MAMIDWISRSIKRYILSPETIAFFVLLFLLYSYVFNGHILWNILERFRVKLELKFTGEYDRVPIGGDKIVTEQKTKASWELKKDETAVYAIQGRRPHMEDRFNVVTDLEHTNTSIYGIFDGHGGEFAADFVEKTLFKTIMVRLLKSALAKEDVNFSSLLTEEILNVDKQLLQVERATSEISGTTALVALLREHELTVANVGDSRGVLCDKDGNAVPLSYDHKPHLQKERRRIKRAGGFISFNGVWRVSGVLATSRALGDYTLKDKNVVIADPDILTFDLRQLRPKFAILATDGLWDAFSNEEAVLYIRERLDEPHFGAKSLVLQAYYRGSLDNVTVMVLNFTTRQIVKVTGPTGAARVVPKPGVEGQGDG